MEITAIYKSAVGLDVHKKHVTACVIVEQADGTIYTEVQEFGTFKRDLIALAAWIKQWDPEVVVMESTGIYWKSVYARLEKNGIIALVVNARHVKNVPGRKTDVSDAMWLAMLARAGLMRKSFIPPHQIRNLRLISRQRQKLVGTLASEKNRLHKALADGGVQLSSVVSDIHGKSARLMTECLLEGGTPEQALEFASSKLKASREELLDALDGDLTDAHRFVMRKIMDHIRYLEAQIAEYDEELLDKLEPCMWAVNLLQTIPGVDKMGAAMLIVEIGVEMEEFGSADRLASWAGMCPGNNESAGKRKSGRIRQGNPYVRRLLCEMANAARRTTSVFRSKYTSLVIRRGHKRSIIALGHKLLRTIFVLLSRKEPYHDPTVDYEQLLIKRKAPRWIAALRKFNLLPASVSKTAGLARV